jgi:hypothetical protein
MFLFSSIPTAMNIIIIQHSTFCLSTIIVWFILRHFSRRHTHVSWAWSPCMLSSTRSLTYLLALQLVYNFYILFFFSLRSELSEGNIFSLHFDVGCWFLKWGASCCMLCRNFSFSWTKQTSIKLAHAQVSQQLNK